MNKKLEKIILGLSLIALPFFGCKAPAEPEEPKYGDIIGKVTQPYITEDERVAYKPYSGINVAIPSIDKVAITDSLGNFDFREVEEGVYEVQANTSYGVLSKAINGGYFDERYQTTKKEVDVLGEKLIKSLGKSILQSSTLEDTLEMLLIPQIGYPTQILHGYVFNKDGTPFENWALNLFMSWSPRPEAEKVRVSYLHPEEMTENKGRYAFYLGANEFYFLSSDGNTFMEFDTTSHRKYINAHTDSLGIIEADAFLPSEKEE